MSLQKCLTDLADALAPYDVAGVQERAKALQAGGLDKKAAELQAVQEKVDELRGVMRSEFEAALPEGVAGELLSDAITDESINSVITGARIPGAEDVKGVAAIADFFDARVADLFGRALNETTVHDKKLIARQVVNEVRWAVARNNSGANWYSSTIDNAMAYAAALHPELETDRVAATAFRLAVAITSNGMDVESNAKYAEQVYVAFKDKGKFPDIGFGTTANAMKSSFKLLNGLVEKNGWDETIDFLTGAFTVRELKDLGFKVNGELMDTQLNGSMIFGPKIGAFFQNLSGNYDPITMDRWFMRSWGRYTGTNNPDPARLQKNLKSLRALIKEMPRAPKGYTKKQLMKDDDALLLFAKKTYDAFSASGFKDRSEINNAARNMMNAIAPVITPRNGKERLWIREVIQEAQAQLAAQGMDINSASLQATIWYLEKDLYAANGVKGKKQEPTDYEREFAKIVKARLGEERADSVGARIQQSQRRHEPGTTQASATEGSTVLNQGFPETYTLGQEPLNGPRPKVGKTDDVEIRTLGQDTLPADLALQELLDSLPDAEVEVIGLGEEADTLEDVSATAYALDSAYDSAQQKTLAHASKEYGYKGGDAFEAAEYIHSYKKFGPEGMTTEARMARAKAMGFNTDQVFYHGTPGWLAPSSTGITAFRLNELRDRPFIFVSPKPAFANKFAENVGSDFTKLPEEVQGMAESDIPKPQVYPLFIRDDNILYLSKLYRAHTGKGNQADIEEYNLVERTINEVLWEEARNESDRGMEFWMGRAAQMETGNLPNGVERHPGVRWRMDAMSRGDWELVENDPVIQEMVDDLGFDGFTVVEGGRADFGFEDPANVENVALYRANDLRSIFAAFDPDMHSSHNLLAQAKNNASRRGEIELRPDNERIIRLFETSNPSTFLHESAHLFLELRKQLASEYGLAELDRKILSALGLRRYQDLSRKEHELFARTFEDYLRQGKAPSINLRDAFAAFGRWLTTIYKKHKQLGLKLTPEVTEIFDRMLATEAELQQVAGDINYDLFFKSKEQAGYTEEEFAKYKERSERRNNRAFATVFEKLVKELTKRRTAEWNEEKAPIRESLMATMQKRRVYQTKEYIQTNKLDPEMVKQALGVDTLPKEIQALTRKRNNFNPEDVAEQFGYTSVEEMVRAVSAAPPIKVAADRAAQEVMIAKYGDILNDGSLNEEVRAAMTNEEQAKIILADLRALNKKTRVPPVDTKYLRHKAQLTVAEMSYPEMNPNKYYRATIRAARQAALAKTPEEAHQYKLQQLANHYLFSEATKGKQEAQRIRDRLRAVEKRKYSGSTVDPKYIQAIKQLVKAYDPSYKPKAEVRLQRARAFTQWLETQIKAGADLTVFDLNIAALQAGQEYLPSFDELTLDQLRGTYDQVKHLRYRGGREASAVKAQREKTRALLIDQAKKTGTDRTQDDWKSTRLDTIAYYLKYHGHALSSLSNMIGTLDGKVGGAFYNEVYVKHLAGGQNKTLLTQDKFSAEFDRLFKGTNIRSINDGKASVRAVTKADGSKWELSARQRFILATYWGEETGRQRIRDGFGVTDAEAMEMMGHLTAEQLEMVKKVWEFSEFQWKDVSEAGMRRDGIVPPKIPPAPFTVNGVSMPGGHLTLFYGKKAYSVEEKFRLDEEPLDSFQTVVNGKASALHARAQKVNKVPLLDTSNIFRSMEENAHYVGFAEAAVELQAILNHDEVRQTLIDFHGEAFDTVLIRSVQSLTTGKRENQGDPLLAWVIRSLRFNKSMMYLAYNVKNVTQQWASVFSAFAETGYLDYTKTALAMLPHWRAEMQFIDENSIQFKSRAQHLNREHADAMRRVVTGSKAEEAFNAFVRHGFTPHVFIDRLIAAPLWRSEYNKAMAAGRTSQEAITEADDAVARGVGSGLDMHLGKSVRSSEHPYMRMMTIFAGWFNSSPYQRAYRALAGNKKGFKPAFEALLVTPMLTMLASEIIIGNLAKGDDEDDPYIPWVLRQTLSFYTAMIPIIGDAVPGQPAMRPSTIAEDAAWKVRQLPNDFNRIMEGEMNGAEMAEYLIDTLGVFVPLPGGGNVTRQLDYQGARMEGNEEFEPTDIITSFTEGSDKNPGR